MRTEEEIRAAIATLERAVRSGAFAPDESLLLATSAATLRYVVGEELTRTPYSEILRQVGETIARREAAYLSPERN